MLYQADWLLSPDGAPLRGGWLRVEGDRITAVGTGADLPQDPEVKSFPGCVLLPGFINAHCHLELTSLHNRLTPGNAFPVWVDELRSHTGSFDPSHYRDAVLEGIDLLLRGGATTVVDVGNTGEALPPLAEGPLRAFGLVETLGLDPSLSVSRFAHASSLAARSKDTTLFHAGVTPHAAYSCSPQLLEAVLSHQRATGTPFSLHASESREEADLFASAAGPLQEFCRRIFPGAPEHPATTPVQWLESLGLLPERALIVHGNHLDAKDIAVLKRRNASVVHCPSSHAFFGHQSFPYRALKAQGIPVCLGTDSLASGDSLSMLDQIRLFRKSFPEATTLEALRMATVSGARALGMEDELGVLKPGFKADFIAVRTGRIANDAPDNAVLKADSEIALSVIDGKETLH